jgi:hypothetical protein
MFFLSSFVSPYGPFKVLEPFEGNHSRTVAFCVQGIYRIDSAQYALQGHPFVGSDHTVFCIVLVSCKSFEDM